MTAPRATTARTDPIPAAVSIIRVLAMTYGAAQVAQALRLHRMGQTPESVTRRTVYLWAAGDQRMSRPKARRIVAAQDRLRVWLARQAR